MGTAAFRVFFVAVIGFGTLMAGTRANSLGSMTADDWEKALIQPGASAEILKLLVQNINSTSACLDIGDSSFLFKFSPSEAVLQCANRSLPSSAMRVSCSQNKTNEVKKPNATDSAVLPYCIMEACAIEARSSITKLNKTVTPVPACFTGLMTALSQLKPRCGVLPDMKPVTVTTTIQLLAPPPYCDNSSSLNSSVGMLMLVALFSVLRLSGLVTGF